MKITVTAPNLADLRRQAKEYDRAAEASIHVATDRATRLGQRAVQQKVKAVGLGRLSGAVRSTSSERKRQRKKGEAWGAVYAAGGDESRAGQALEAYTRGATIKGKNVEWLAIATRALPKRVGRYRMTPQRYEAAGNPLGPLIFKRLSVNRAILIAQGDFTVSVKTGKAKRFAGRATRARKRQRDVVAFVLIKQTKRGKRFDQREVMRRASAKLPDFIGEEMERRLPRDGETR